MASPFHTMQDVHLGCLHVAFRVWKSPSSLSYTDLESFVLVAGTTNIVPFHSFLKQKIKIQT